MRAVFLKENLVTPIIELVRTCANHTVPYGTALWGGLSQALRARLRSCCLSGTRILGYAFLD